MSEGLRFASMRDLLDYVVCAGMVLSVEMRVVRDASGNERLGRLVRERVAGELRRLGLGHFPRVLPDRQDDLIRLYVLGSPVGNLIEAVLAVGTEGDYLLRCASQDAELAACMHAGEVVVLAR
ncbi:MAG: hypothetical protein ACYCS7_17100 [Acidimicrobiales bacterium]